MIPRPKLKRLHHRAPHIMMGVESDAKDQLMCKLELQQTVYAETMQRLERTREELETLRTGFSLLYDRSPIGYITFDKRGHIYNVNGTALKLLGYDHPRLIHLPLSVLVHPQDGKALLTHLWRCENEDKAKIATDLRLRTKDQNYITVQLVSVPFAAVKERKMFLTAIIDMTERYKHERALAETKEFAEAIVQTVNQPLAVLDSDLRIVSVNQAFADLFKRPSQYIRGRVFEVMLNLWWSGNQLRNELEKVLVKNQPLEDYRIEVEPPDIGKRILLINARPLHQKTDMPKRLLVALEDVTEREWAREEVRKVNEQLEQRVSARTDALRKSYEQMEAFCYTIAHDLRAPLRSMTGFSHLLTEQFGPEMSTEGKDYAERIQQSAERMDHLIRDLLSYGRLNTAAMPANKVDMEKIFQEVLAHQEKEIQDKGAKIRKTNRLPVVSGHHAILHAILSNLIGNALKFVPPDVRPRVAVCAEDRGDWTRVWVTDNGIGIAPENRGKIFGVFQRLHSADTYPGTGIGLAIVAKGVERMGGRLGVESEPGKGSRFWFELPRQAPH